MNNEEFQFLYPSISNIDVAWLKKIFPSSALNKLIDKPHAGRIAMRSLYSNNKISVPNMVDFQPEQQWLLMKNSEQRILAKQLGVLACIQFISTTIKKEAVKQLYTVFRKENYLDFLEKEKLLVTGLNRQDYDMAIDKQYVDYFLMAVGVSLLKFTVDEENPFFYLRMSFIFPPVCWNMRPKKLSVNQSQLIKVIEEAIKYQESTIYS